MTNSETTIYSIRNKNKKAYVAEFTTMELAKNNLPKGSEWSIDSRQISKRYANSCCLDILMKITPEL